MNSVLGEVFETEMPAALCRVLNLESMVATQLHLEQIMNIKNNFSLTNFSTFKHCCCAKFNTCLHKSSLVKILKILYIFDVEFGFYVYKYQ